MKTEQLIAELARDGSAARRGARSPARGLAAWLAGSAATIALAIGILGGRSDIAAKLATPRYVFELALVLSVMTSSGVVALMLAFPARFRPRLVLPAIGTFLAAWLGALAALALLERRAGFPAVGAWGYSCALTAVVVALVPAALLVVLVRRAAPTHPRLNALAIGVSAFGAGAVALHLHCGIDGAFHQLAWHAAPVLVVAAVAAGAGWRALRW